MQNQSAIEEGETQQNEDLRVAEQSVITETESSGPNTATPHASQLTERDFTRLLARLRVNTGRWRIVDRYLSTLVFGCLLALLSIIWFTNASDGNPLPVNTSELVVLLSFVTALVFRGYVVRWNVAKKLAQTKDPRIVGVMTDALIASDRRTRLVAARSLIELLPNLYEDYHPLLGQRQRRKLDAIIQRKDADVETLKLQRAILQGYGMVGDATSLKIVQTLSNETDGVPQSIRDAAKSCLLLLEPRLTAPGNNSELLRGASPHRLPDDMLVRPASREAGASEQELLRSRSDPGGQP